MRARRKPIVDEYVEDGRAAVYTTAGMVVLLSELATSAWTLIGDEWVASGDVTTHLVEAYGDPGEGDADQLTEQALESLAEMSLIELETGAPA